MSEAAEHPHIRARDTVVEFEGVLQPAPAPRFSRTPAELRRGAPRPGEHTDTALADWGFSAEELQTLHEAGAIR
jgi:alpha-methylacyl-CoA racemase